jgi:membrane protease YdiL (CAAX protease family)
MHRRWFRRTHYKRGGLCARSACSLRRRRAFALLPESLFAFAVVLNESQMPPFEQSADGSSSKYPHIAIRVTSEVLPVVFAFSIPFWLAGAATTLQLLPGIPLAALMFICPAAAALILVCGENKTAGMLGLLERSFEYKRIRSKVWYAPILLLMPSVMVLSYGLMRLIGVPLPTPQFQIPEVPALLLVFFVAAQGEELGWSGYVLDPMQDRWGALRAGILLGLVWAAWHIIPLLQAHRSRAWIAWWCLGHGSNAGPDGLALQQQRQERFLHSHLP